MADKAKFKTKAFTSFTITWAFLVTSIAGIILFIAPQGRIANWNVWTIWGLDKEQWGAVHTLMSFLFLILAIFHLFVFNWAVFKAYLKDRVNRGVKLKRELYSSLALVLILGIGTYYEIPPFQTIMDIGGRFDTYWENKTSAPPVSHAEDLTLSALASEQLNSTSAEVMQILGEMNITADEGDMLGTIAENNQLSPAELYEQIHSKIQSNATETAKKGYGQMPLNKVCVDMDISVITAYQYLQSEGIAVSSDTETLYNIAAANGKKATDLVKMLIARFGT